ncbi:MAG: ribonucleoside triphosphate reductase, partial [Eubacteriales bacterium]
GYYRPVQNWNDGKLQEYKERKVYDIANSHLDEGRIARIKEAEEKEACGCKESDAREFDIPMLVTTRTCPNCKIAASMLDKAGIVYNKVLADEERDIVAKFGIKQAPTLIAVMDGKPEAMTGVAAIKAYIG